MDEEFLPETLRGDYAEAYQKWSHEFGKNNDMVGECFKNSKYVPFEPLNETPERDPFDALKSMIKILEKKED